MIINRAYKTKLDPTRNQRQYFAECGRVSRTVYNWMLADYNVEYAAWYAAYQQAIAAGIAPPEEEDKAAAWTRFAAQAGEAGIVVPLYPKPGGRGARKKRLNQIKYERDNLKFLTLYPYVILQEAADDFERALKNYAEKRKLGLVAQKIAERKESVKWKRRLAKLMDRGYVGAQLNPYYPHFKSRFDSSSFRLLGAIKIGDRTIELPRLGSVRLAEAGYIPTDPAKMCYVTLSEDRSDWYVSVTVEIETDEKPPALQPVKLGVSVGVMDLAATSTGDYYENPRALRQYEKKKKRLQRELSRRTHLTPDGKVDRLRSNWQKTKAKLSKVERKIERVRSHEQHVASKRIADTRPAQIVLKAMDIQAMQKNPVMAPKIGDAGMGETTRRITYKAGWNGTRVTETKAAVAAYCSRCGSWDTSVNYDSRMLHCKNCGLDIRVSLNTANNLARIDID